MGIYRGAGGTGDAINDASSEAILTVQARDDAIAAKVAAEAAQLAAQAAQANAEIAETNAETAETNAETAATNAAASAATASSAIATTAASASAAATSASNAANSASAASTSASNAATSESNAATSASNAASSASAASTSASNAATSESNAASSASAAAASYDSFDDRYLGSKTSDPTLDNDGNTLLVGALYFNSNTNEMRVWNGSTWLVAYVSLSGALIATNNLSDLNNAATARDNLGVEIGVDVQAYDPDTAKYDDVTANFTGTLQNGGSNVVVDSDIGVTVQAYDAQLADVAGLTPADNNFIVGNGTNFVTESGSTARTSLGLGSIATQDANNVAVTGGSINGTAVGASTPSTGSFTSLTDSGNLTFTGTGNRITGDFSNATLANRVAFQTSTLNSATRINATPSGTGTVSEFGLFNNADPTNAGYAAIRMRSGDMQITSEISGTGTYLPLTMFTGGSERLRIDTSGNVGIGTSSPSTALQVNGTVTATSFSGANAAKAWVNFNGSTAGIRAAFNVSSITKNATGDYTANFAASLGDGNYAFAGSARLDYTGADYNGGFIAGFRSTNEATTCRFLSKISNNTVSSSASNTDCTEVYFIAFR